MFKLFVISTFVAVTSAGGGGYGSSGGGRSSGGYSSGGSSSGGYSGGGSSGGGGSGYSGGVIPAAIQTRHEIQFKDVPSTGSVQPATIEVGASAIPLNILFRSASSNLNVLQQHTGGGGDTQESNSEDEPHVLKHSVTKPIIQEIREIITPFRKIVQEIQPVSENVLTIIAKGTEERQSGGFSGGQSSYGGGALGLGGSIGSGISIGGGSSSSSSSGVSEIKATSGTGLGKGLAGKSAGGYASSAKASSGGTKGY